MVDDPWAVEVLGICEQLIPVLSLVSRLTVVVALPVHLPSNDLDGFLEVQPFGKDAKQVDDPSEIVDVAVNAVGYS